MPIERQPIHTVYGGAHLFRADTAQKLGRLALRALDEHAADADVFADALQLRDLPAERRAALYQRVRDKLAREPVEDLRIDFEDGYGHRPDAEEDGHADSSAAEVARGLAAGTLPPALGLRIKALSVEQRARALRTLERFLRRLCAETGGALPPGMVVTLPKVQAPEEVRELAAALTRLEVELGLPPGVLRVEIMIETPQAIYNERGEAAPRGLWQAGGGRVRGAALGSYDYTAALDITAAEQRLDHPACDFAKQVLQVALAGTGAWLSDGATTAMPVGPRDTVWAAWRVHAHNIRHGLRGGYYQGWDLHPAQLPVRYAVAYDFYLRHLQGATERLANFVDKAAQATRVGAVFDDAATGQGLLNFFLRGLACGAITEAEALHSGLRLEELRSRSFMQIVEGRRDAATSSGTRRC